jgi:hypothetical protein
VTSGISSLEDWSAQPKARRPHRVIRDLGEIFEAKRFAQRELAEHSF